MRSIWQNMPLRSFALLLLAVFFTFMPMGFLIDVSSLGSNSPRRLAAVAVFSGFIAAAYVFSARNRRVYLPRVVASHVPSWWPRAVRLTRSLAWRQTPGCEDG